MLLPSALTCDSSRPAPKTRYQNALFASPPLSPPAQPSTYPAITNIYSTCRALQSMLTTPNQLPSPPTTHAEPPSSPFKLRLRQRKAADETAPSTNGGAAVHRRKITKRAQAPYPPPRGLNKRRRALDDDMTRDTEFCDDADSEADDNENDGSENIPHGPSTPKRMRFAPEILPLGLERSDFHSLALQRMTAAEGRQGQGQNRGDDVLDSIEDGEEADGGSREWSTEEDRQLVELVLEKLKLSKSDWQDCARSLGKDRGSVGKRWKSLMGAGEVGLKNRPRRARIHGTWR